MKSTRSNYRMGKNITLSKWVKDGVKESWKLGERSYDYWRVSEEACNKLAVACLERGGMVPTDTRHGGYSADESYISFIKRQIKAVEVVAKAKPIIASFDITDSQGAEGGYVKEFQNNVHVASFHRQNPMIAKFLAEWGRGTKDGVVEVEINAPGEKVEFSAREGLSQASIYRREILGDGFEDFTGTARLAQIKGGAYFQGMIGEDGILRTRAVKAGQFRAARALIRANRDNSSEIIRRMRAGVEAELKMHPGLSRHDTIASLSAIPGTGKESAKRKEARARINTLETRIVKITLWAEKTREEMKTRGMAIAAEPEMRELRAKLYYEGMLKVSLEHQEYLTFSFKPSTEYYAAKEAYESYAGVGVLADPSQLRNPKSCPSR